MKKNLIKGFIFLNILFLLLLIVNSIPQKMVSKGILSSLDYYSELDNRIEEIQGYAQTTNDTITDILVLNLIYNLDTKNLIKSTLEAPYYYEGYENYNKQLEKTILNHEEPNENYSRYWHGYAIVYRILLVFFNVSEIKIIMIIAYTILFIYLMIISIKKNMKSFALLFLLSFILSTNFWGFYTLGHLAPIFISIIGCIYIIKTEKINELLLFLYLGISVSFFDFLSIEIISLTLPTLCLLMKQNNNNALMSKKTFIKINCNWLIGYLFAYIYKWILTICFCGIENLNTIFYKGIEKIITNNNMFTGLTLNIQMLFPNINSNRISCTIFIITLTFLISFIYLFHKKNCNANNFITYNILIFLIPYIRYIILANHAFVHYFFTYRAQISSIFALLLIIISSIDIRLIKETFKNIINSIKIFNFK